MGTPREIVWIGHCCKDTSEITPGPDLLSAPPLLNPPQHRCKLCQGNLGSQPQWLLWASPQVSPWLTRTEPLHDTILNISWTQTFLSMLFQLLQHRMSRKLGQTISMSTTHGKCWLRPMVELITKAALCSSTHRGHWCILPMKPTDASCRRSLEPAMTHSACCFLKVQQ